MDRTVVLTYDRTAEPQRKNSVTGPCLRRGGKPAGRRHGAGEGLHARHDHRGRRHLFGRGGARRGPALLVHRLHGTRRAGRQPFGDRRHDAGGPVGAGGGRGRGIRHADAQDRDFGDLENGRQNPRKHAREPRRGRHERPYRRLAGRHDRRYAGFGAEIPDPRRFVDQQLQRSDRAGGRRRTRNGGPEPERHRVDRGAQGRRVGRYLRFARIERRDSHHHQEGRAPQGTADRFRGAVGL